MPLFSDNAAPATYDLERHTNSTEFETFNEKIGFLFLTIQILIFLTFFTTQVFMFLTLTTSRSLCFYFPTTELTVKIKDKSRTHPQSDLKVSKHIQIQSNT